MTPKTLRLLGKLVLPVLSLVIGNARASAQAFPVGIDASPLSAAQVFLHRAGDSEIVLSEAGAEIVTLNVGTHQVHYGGFGIEASVSFEVTSAGSIAYGPSAEGMLRGAGTTSLTVVGLPIGFDASALQASPAGVNYVAGDPLTPLSLRLLPGRHKFAEPAGQPPAVGPHFEFDVSESGTVGYDAALEGILTGGGTPNLTVHGRIVHVDATLIREQFMGISFIGSGTLDVPRDLPMLPGNYHFQYSSGTPNAPGFFFTVNPDGSVAFDPALDGIVSSPRVGDLIVLGRAIVFDDSRLTWSLKGLPFSFGPNDPATHTYRLLPGSHLYQQVTSGDLATPYFLFDIANDGTVSYDPSYEGILLGSGTSHLTIHGIDLLVDATAIESTLKGLTFSSIVTPSTPFHICTLPGNHEFAYSMLTPGANVAFRVEVDGTVSYIAALEGILRGAGTSSITIAGMPIRIAAGSRVVGMLGFDVSSCVPIHLLPGRVPGQYPPVLLPAPHLLQLPDDLAHPILFSVSPLGTVDYDATLDSRVAGRGTDTLALRDAIGTFVVCTPIANAGIDITVDEGQGVALDGSNSIPPTGATLTFAWTQQPGGTRVALIGADTAHPTFLAPSVALGGETLSFELTVAAAGQSSTDTVSVTVTNVNHQPVADAGADQTAIEGATVTLHGEASFDVDNDTVSHAWTQVSGPAVSLVGANSANPSFTAPAVGPGGTQLVFELRVDDQLPVDRAAPGFALGNNVDRVTVAVTDTDNPPLADAGPDQVVDEDTIALLDGTSSQDPDGDALSYAWSQTAGPPVLLTAADTARPFFRAPFVGTGGTQLTFALTVNDGNGAQSTDQVVVRVANTNDPPIASGARPTIALLWPPNHGLVEVGITGVSDPDGNAQITITGVTQDEPTQGLGDGDTAVDAVIRPNGTVLLRAERSGNGNGRVYHVHFTASDPEGTVSGVVTVSVPRDKNSAAVDGGELHDSTR